MSQQSGTHLVPDGGLDAWASPDGTQPAVARLDPGLAVSVRQWHGDWAHIVCSNGWSGWVDGRRLVPVGAATAPEAGARRRGRPSSGVVVATLIVVAVIIAAIATSG